MKKAVLKQANTGEHNERELVETLLNCGSACSNWRNSPATSDMALLLVIATDVVLVSE